MLSHISEYPRYRGASRSAVNEGLTYLLHVAVLNAALGLSSIAEIAVVLFFKAP
jgi:hypothetical protein